MISRLKSINFVKIDIAVGDCYFNCSVNIDGRMCLVDKWRNNHLIAIYSDGR